MPYCSPQRFLPNNLNLFRDALLSASSVLPVVNKVRRLSHRGTGNAQVTLTGTYTGAEQADYDLEIVDTDVDVNRISTPTFSGAGSGALTNITASGAQQIYTVELSNPGTQTTAASVQLEGATIKAAVEGAGGNSIRIIVDQSALVFTESNYSLLLGMNAGQGGPTSPLIGEGFNWDSAVLDANGLIPTGAHRVSFGNDRSRIYLAYKEWKSGQWEYHTVPALTHDVPREAKVYFVTGGRTVTVTDGSSTEIYTNIVTAYDLLIGLRAGTQSALTVVEGVVVNDRSPTGQAARELALRTDAHAEVSTGNSYYTLNGFSDVTVTPGAGTQTVTATCFAVTSADDPLARLGSERWNLRSSLLGNLGTIVTGRPYSGSQFGLTIPVQLPPSGAAAKGRFTAEEPRYVPRVGVETEPPICPVALSLGPDAVDETITLTYTAPKSGDCNCASMAVPNLHTPCLGALDEEGGLMAYQADTIARILALRTKYKGWVRLLSNATTPPSSATEAYALTAPLDAWDEGTAAIAPVTPPSPYYARQTESILTVVNNLESALALIDAVTDDSPGNLRAAGCAAWDTATAEFVADIETWCGLDTSPPSPVYTVNIPSDRYDASINMALISAGIPTVGGADANILNSGDGCWRDYGGPFWKVEGSAKGIYAPLFSNHPYYACRPAANGGYYSTHEFALQLNIKCVSDLKYGDQIILHINDAARGATYQVGSEFYMDILAAAPLYLTGGVNGSPIQTWTVNGTVDGPLPAYTYDPDSPTPYSDSGLGFTLTAGGIPFAKGDRFRFAVEGGHYRWRKDGGAWDGTSPPLAIPAGTEALDAGLSVTFAAGAAASFVAGDVYSFRALQPWAVSNVQTPSSAVWKWSGSSATLEAEFDEEEQLDLFAMLHTLPAGASISLSGGVDTSSYTWTESMTYRAGAIWKAIDRTAKFVKIEITNATGGSVQWPWLGVPLTTTLSADVQLRRGYQINRPGGNLQGGRFIGKTVSGEVSWTESALVEADVDGLAAMLDYVKGANDEPIMFIPQITREDDEVLFARINSDDVDFPDTHGYNKNVAFERRVSASIPLAGVWQ